MRGTRIQSRPELLHLIYALTNGLGLAWLSGSQNAIIKENILKNLDTASLRGCIYMKQWKYRIETVSEDDKRLALAQSKNNFYFALSIALTFHTKIPKNIIFQLSHCFSDFVHVCC